MIQSDYALSFNVKRLALDILTKVADFKTWDGALGFVTWFNSVIDAKGRVVLTEICDKKHLDSIEAFSRIGFNHKIRENDIIELTSVANVEFYRLMFPVLRDFTQKGAK